MTELEFFAALARPFDPIREIRRREIKGKGGAVSVEFVSARTVQNRLDEVCGPAGWWTEYRPFGEAAVVCRLSIRTPDGSVLTREDVGGFSETRDESDFEKTGFSDSFKRAAVTFGVGRHLYGDGIPATLAAELNDERLATGRRSDSRPVEPEAVAGTIGPGTRGGAGGGGKPGARLWAWIKDHDEDGSKLKAVSVHGAQRGWPRRVLDWSEEECREASELLRSLGSGNGGRRAAGR